MAVEDHADVNVAALQPFVIYNSVGLLYLRAAPD